MKTKFKGKALASANELHESGIKFKGSRWIEGYLIEQNDNAYIINGVIEANSEYISIEEWVPVKPETVSEFTGLIDLNGVDIFEGDEVSSQSSRAAIHYIVRKDKFFFYLEAVKSKRQFMLKDYVENENARLTVIRSSHDKNNHKVNSAR